MRHGVALAGVRSLSATLGHPASHYKAMRALVHEQVLKDIAAQRHLPTYDWTPCKTRESQKSGRRRRCGGRVATLRATPCNCTPGDES